MLFACEHVYFGSTVLTMVNVYCEHVYFGSTVLTMVNVYLRVSMCILAVLYLPW